MPLGQLVRGVGAGGSTPLFHRVGATRDARRQTREDLADADKLRVSEAFACALGAENIDLEMLRGSARVPQRKCTPPASGPRQGTGAVAPGGLVI